MASGFVQRWKGKVLAQLLGLGANGIKLYSRTGQESVSPADLYTISGAGGVTAATTAALAIAAVGVTGISSVGGSTYNLAAPKVGASPTIYSAAIGDGVRKVFAGAGVTFQSSLAGASYLNFSTAAVQSIALYGISTAAWIVKNNVGGVTVSTA